MKSANVSVLSVSGHCVEAVPVNELLMSLHYLCVVCLYGSAHTHCRHHHPGSYGFDDNGDNDDDDDAVGNDNEYVDGRSHPVIHQGLV